ncbi:PREDICTED: uncharacterized protein LOC108361376 [Rhagoletis zephyria]|nr:PREDICTED: uncharacterized protein LOC108361376 [Rhagoletis zephyria]
MEFWQNVAKELDSLVPPTKGVSSWKKVWFDWKAYIKRKPSENKKEQAATGGGRNRQHHFNELEEEVFKVTDLETSTHGITGTVSVGIPSAGEVGSCEADPDVSMVSENCSPSLPRRPPTVQKRADTSAAELLKEQLELQKNFQQKSVEHFAEQNAKLDALASNMQRLCSAVERMCDVKEADLEETRRHHRHMQNLNAAKNYIKNKCWR